MFSKNLKLDREILKRWFVSLNSVCVLKLGLPVNP